jgi:hypothetical protein
MTSTKHCTSWPFIFGKSSTASGLANEIMLKLQSEREFKTTNNIYVMLSVFTITTSTCHP